MATISMIIHIKIYRFLTFRPHRRTKQWFFDALVLVTSIYRIRFRIITIGYDSENRFLLIIHTSGRVHSLGKWKVLVCLNIEAKHSRAQRAQQFPTPYPRKPQRPLQ